MNKVPFYFFPCVYIAGRGLVMELGCLQSLLTTGLSMLRNLWEVGEGTWEGGKRQDIFGPGPEAEESGPLPPLLSLCKSLNLP